jgi:hypothetical protein
MTHQQRTLSQRALLQMAVPLGRQSAELLR